MTWLLKIFGLPGSIALAVAIGALSACIWLWVALAGAEAARSVAEIEADVAQGRATANAASATSWKATALQRHTLLLECQAENTRIAVETAAGLEAADAARKDAERSAALFADRYAASLRIPACVKARQNLDAACPAMEY